MNIEELREYALSLPETTEAFPFDETTLVFKVKEKLFVLTSLDSSPLWVNLKCDPEMAIDLRERYESVTPGYHMNKRLWNTHVFDGEMSDTEIKYWVKHSYIEVVKKLPKRDREVLLEQL